MSDHPSKLATIEFPTSLWIKYPIPWCWNTFLGDNNFGGGKKGTSSQIDGTLGLRKDTLLFPIFCFKRKLARKICYIYWTSETNNLRKYSHSLVYLKNGFVPLYHFPCAVGKSHVVGKVIMGVQWDHDIVHFLPRWHKTIRLLYCSIFFHHRPPRTDYLTDTLPFGAEKYTRNTSWYRIFWWILFTDMFISINISSTDKTKESGCMQTRKHVSNICFCFCFSFCRCCFFTPFAHLECMIWDIISGAWLGWYINPPSGRSLIYLW